jgi:hypothetical protein
LPNCRKFSRQIRLSIGGKGASQEYRFSAVLSAQSADWGHDSMKEIALVVFLFLLSLQKVI